MSLIKTILSFFNKHNKKPVDDWWNKPHQEILSDIEIYKRKHLEDAAVQAQALELKFGNDFYRVFYQPDIDKFIREQLIPVKEPAIKYTGFLEHDHWLKKHPFNFPGPFFTGESDTCGTGDIQAPDNVLYDEYACEFIFRQPQNYTELVCIIDAGAMEVLDSYSCNGNQYWTYQKCKDWWKDKTQLLHELGKDGVIETNGERVKLYTDYLNGKAETDLRKYCYFLEYGVYPADENEKLPIVSV